MRILMIQSTPFPPEEGIGYFTYNLSRKLIEKENEVTILTRDDHSESIFEIEGIRVIKVPFIPAYPLHLALHKFFLDKTIKSIAAEYDLIHIQTPLTPVPNSTLPIISTIHSSMIENALNIESIDLRSVAIKLLTKFVTYPNIKKLINKSQIVTTVSFAVSDELERHYSVENSIIIGNGVNERLFCPIDGNQEPTEEPYFLYVGRLSYGKGLFDLIEAAKLFLENIEIKFVLCGKGELTGRIQNALKDYGIEDKFQIVGQIDHQNLIDYYRNALAFIFPSHYEGLPTAVLEAMSCGLPAIVTDIPAFRQLIENGNNGLTFRKGSPTDLADKMSILFRDRKLRERIGKEARITIENSYTWDRVCDRVIQIYDSVINQGR